MIWTCDVMVIGGGPAGLAAAIAADKEGARVVLVERARFFLCPPTVCFSPEEVL